MEPTVPVPNSVSSDGSFPERAERLMEVARPLSGTLIRKHPLMIECGIGSFLFNQIKEAVDHYLYVNLSAAFPARPISRLKDILSENAELIERLPNLTPNGLLLPKMENAFAYNEVHHAFAKVVEALQIGSQIKSIHAPINIRIVSGEPNPAVDSRPRATTKLHSDIWAGEATDAVMMFLPIYGDMIENGIENFEPSREFLGFLRPLPDFSEGAFLEKESTRYTAPMNLGWIYLTDPFLLHRTRKRRKGLRLSIDVRVRTKQLVSSDVGIPSNREENYLPLLEWSGIGVSRVLVSDSSMFDFDSNQPDSASSRRNEYAARFRIIDLLRRDASG